MVVTFEDGPMARLYVEETGLDWPLLVDHERSLYQAFGMDRGSKWEIWGPKTWWAYLREGLRGQRLKAATGDPDQLGGDVIVDPDGTVRLHHVGRGPADRPPIDQLLELVRAHQTLPGATLTG